jgi:hypothetical protein
VILRLFEKRKMGFCCCYETHNYVVLLATTDVFIKYDVPLVVDETMMTEYNFFLIFLELP